MFRLLIGESLLPAEPMTWTLLPGSYLNAWSECSNMVRRLWILTAGSTLYPRSFELDLLLEPDFDLLLLKMTGGDLLFSLPLALDLNRPGDLLLDLDCFYVAGFLERDRDFFFRCFSNWSLWLLTSVPSNSKFSFVMTG